MKILLVLVLAIASTLAFLPPRPADQVQNSWGCSKLSEVNEQSQIDHANNTKCQYVAYLIWKLKQEYTTTQYPSCYSQIDAVCDVHITDYYEKLNIRQFQVSTFSLCNSDDSSWEHLQTVFNAQKAANAAVFGTDYWTCIGEQIDNNVTKEFVTAPSFPPPYLDVMNFVCQQVQINMRNVDRVAFNTFFDDNAGFKKLDNVGKPLFQGLASKFIQSGLSQDLVACMSFEASSFANSVVPEVDGSRSVYKNDGQAYEQAYSNPAIDEDEDEEDLGIAVPISMDEDGYPLGYECWNYYAPEVHYKQPLPRAGKQSVQDDQFSGNKGHPLCPEHNMYQPFTRYGPMCCPISKNVRRKPYTYNCCQRSDDLYWQNPRTKRLMNRRKACYGCTCLAGSSLSLDQDYFGLGDTKGACVQDSNDIEG